MVPLVGLELALRPFADFEPEIEGVRKTTLFISDDRLGWRLRPGAEDDWGGVRVRVNAKGLRGPELSYAKSHGIKRILYLGDSVPFGYKIASHDQTYPYLVQRILESWGGERVETINAGVGGYSPWQEYEYLASEGVRYEPDLVVVTFVLNDVTEKFDLIRFGGTSDGFQLARSVRSTADRVLGRSAIRLFGRRSLAWLRFGDDVQGGARSLAALRANELALAPDEPRIQRAWEVTLGNLDRIFDYCAKRAIPAMLVVFPYTFQLEDPDRFDAPQRELRDYARARDLSFVDLLPAYTTAMLRHDEPATTFFVDEDHPTPRGNVVAASVIARKIQDASLLGSPAASGARGHPPAAP